MKHKLKYFVPIFSVIGLILLFISYLDLGSLEGHGKVQNKQFEVVEQKLSSEQTLTGYMLFRPYSSDGINASGDIQGFLWSESDNVLHGHLSSLAKPASNGSTCIDWTVNGLGVICHKGGNRVHPCNAGRRVLEAFPFYEYDLQNMLIFEDKIVSNLTKLSDQEEVSLGDFSCKLLEKFNPTELPESATCVDNKFASCESSQ